MAQSVIEQHPKFNTLPAGQDIIFVVSNNTAVANETKVKFGVEVHISNTTPPNVSTANDLIGVFKATPNNAGVGIFDLRNIVENYVKPDNMGALGSRYKTTTTTVDDRHPLHLIDSFSLSNNSFRYMALQFFVEYLNTTTNVVERAAGTSENSDLYQIFNGYLKYSDELEMSSPTSANFGFDMQPFRPKSTQGKFLTNAPATLYSNINDYGTLSFLSDSVLANEVTSVRFEYFALDGTLLGGESVDKTIANGAYTSWAASAENLLVHIGCYPGNLQNWSTTFKGLITAGTIQGGYYTVKLAGVGAKTQDYTINLNCPNSKGYESVRLCWLNQWGVWDYYTFTQKSVRSTTTKGSTYNQLQGTWNQSKYRIDSFKGGKKAFRVNATEKITMNTEFVTEADTVVFEELINSPEVYLLEGYRVEITNAALNQYVTPVRLTTSSFTRKTVANDKLMQYTFEVEKSKTLRTQSV